MESFGPGLWAKQGLVSSREKTIALANIGVHQIFQLALAAQEIGRLDRLYCSFADKPRSWGRVVSKLYAGAIFKPLGGESIHPHRICELPWGMIRRKLPSLVRAGRQPENFLASNILFATGVAKRLASDGASMFVGTETCALECFRAAKRLGMTCVLDCPGIPDTLLAGNVSRAAEELGIQVQVSVRDKLMEDRKLQELELADHVLLCSDLQREGGLGSGKRAEQLSVNPLWVDDCFLSTERPVRSANTGGRLRVLYAGAISVAKGVPYLIAACQLAKNDCQLTLCGTMDPQIATWAQQRGATYELIPKVPRQQLPQVFRNYDVLVLPSLGDSFGFIALEAMASGLPVIVTDAAGVPVPDTAWRVPTHCANSIADRLVQYAQQRERLLEDSETATRFGRQFTAEQFRRRAGAIFTSLLAST